MEMRRTIAALGLAALLSVPRAAGAADSPATPNDAMSATARDLFLKGVDAWKHGRWDQCRASLLAAWSIKPVRQIAGNLAACEIKLGKYRDAAEHLAFLLRPAAGGARPELSPEHRKLLAEASARVGSLRVDAEPGASILVDGQSVGLAPLADPLFLEPGDHLVEARPELGPAARATVSAAPGVSQDISLRAATQQQPQQGEAKPPATSTPAPVQKSRSIPFTWVPIWVDGVDHALYLVVGHTGLKRRLLLITDRRPETSKDAGELIQAYLERWGSEEVTRACKQLTGLEKIRVRSFPASRRLLWLAMIAAGIQALIILTRPRLRQAILDRAKEFIPKVRFVLYRIWRVVQTDLRRALEVRPHLFT